VRLLSLKNSGKYAGRSVIGIRKKEKCSFKYQVIIPGGFGFNASSLAEAFSYIRRIKF